MVLDRGGIQSEQKKSAEMNHENTKSKKHEMFRAYFRDFVMKKKNVEHLSGRSFFCEG
jgi:hypothetical protein